MNKTTFRTRLRRLHLWLAIPSGLIVLVIALTGALYAFAEELRPLLYRAHYFVPVPPQASPLPLGQLQAVAQLALGEDRPIGSLEAYADPARTVVFRASASDKDALTYFGQVVYDRKAYVNPYTAEVVHLENAHLEFFQLMLALHRYLWLNKSVGSQLGGVAVLLFVGLLLTGAWLGWRRQRTVRSNLAVRWRAIRPYDVHRLIGFYALSFGLVAALTGLVWAFEWYASGMKWLANGGQALEAPAAPKQSVAAPTADLPLDDMLADARGQMPTAHTFSISLPTDPDGVVRITARPEPRYRRERFTYDRHDGQRLHQTHFGELPPGDQARALNYDVHTGAVLGLFGKVLVCLGSLGTAALPITGFYLWQQRRQRAHDRPARPRSATSA